MREMTRSILLWLTVLILISGATSHAQVRADFQSNPKLNFPQYINGIKHADIVYPNEIQEYIGKDSRYGHFFLAAKKYLLSLGIPSVSLTTQEKVKMVTSVKSVCDVVNVSFNAEIEKNKLKSISMTFVSCKGDIFQFNRTVNLPFKGNSAFQDRMITELRVIYSLPYKYEQISRLTLGHQMTKWTEPTIRKKIAEENKDPLEGVYERLRLSPEDHLEGKYRVGIVKDPTDDGYSIIYLAGASNSVDWKEGELKGRLTPTGTPGFFKVIWYDMVKDEIDDAYAFIDEANLLNIQITGMHMAHHRFVRLFPTGETQRFFSASGSGFALSQDGYIVTNHHVIDGAKEIWVSWMDKDTIKQYEAKVLVSDKKADLAILKVVDDNFKTLPEIPYSFSNEAGEKGEGVFVLGYPMITAMGEGIKLTNGIISSSSGFQGDPNSYQISAPIQPGNSGGPLFDSEGKLIGVINAKLLQAENVSYAIKLDLLLQLIEQLDNKPDIPKGDLSGLPLKEQTKRITPFVCLIKTTY